MTDMNEDNIGYGERIRLALRSMIRDILQETADSGLTGAHHFYISFDTRMTGVVISDSLRADHPEDMTIILQNQFADLLVTDDYFSVRLYFNHRPETLIIPFAAITRFYDPSVSFGLVFEDHIAPDISVISGDSAMGQATGQPVGRPVQTQQPQAIATEEAAAGKGAEAKGQKTKRKKKTAEKAVPEMPESQAAQDTNPTHRQPQESADISESAANEKVVNLDSFRGNKN